MRDIHDHYFHKAKAEGYLARSAYKLIEINDRRKILNRGDRVLDCGCAPGSWLQVAAERVGPKGVVVGIDLQPVTHRFDSPNIITIAGDLTDTPAATLLAATSDPTRKFDVILSDMAPNTSGDPSGDHHRSVRLCQAVLARCPDLLRHGGNLAIKVFEGEVIRELVAEVREQFDMTKAFKPKACRSESRETYIIAMGYQGVPRGAEAAKPQAEGDPRAPRRSVGWAR
jgi:23S rRNA (uridine2552-2'-O)-methyltransferase